MYIVVLVEQLGAFNRGQVHNVFYLCVPVWVRWGLLWFCGSKFSFTTRKGTTWEVLANLKTAPVAGPWPPSLLGLGSRA